MSMTDLPFVIPTTSKSVRFLLACLIRKLAKWEISWNEWNLLRIRTTFLKHSDSYFLNIRTR